MKLMPIIIAIETLTKNIYHHRVASISSIFLYLPTFTKRRYFGMIAVTYDKFKNFKSMIKTFDVFISPEDIYRAIYPLYYIGWLFGVAPYGLLKQNGKVTVETGIIAKIRSLIQISLFVAGVAWNVYLRPYPFSSSDISIKLEYLQDIFSALLSAVEVIVGCVFASKIAAVFRSIEEIDRCFQRLAIWVPYK